MREYMFLTYIFFFSIEKVLFTCYYISDERWKVDVMIKECCVCGYKYTSKGGWENSHPLTTPHTDGAKLYFDMWHFQIDVCPECGYASRDISKCVNKKIIEDEGYLAIDDLPVLKEMSDARPNSIGLYLKAGAYYKSIGETYNEALCYLQASDLVFAEIIYWQQYLFDDSDAYTAYRSKGIYNDFKDFADKFYNRAIELLEEWVKIRPRDVQARLVLAGALSDGNAIQKMRSVKILNAMKTEKITNEQKKVLSFLLGDIR